MANTFTQTPVAGSDTGATFPLEFPAGTIIRAVCRKSPQHRVTILIKRDGRIKTLRDCDRTWKDPLMHKFWEGTTTDEFMGTIRAWSGYTITADIQPPKGWWRSAGLAYRALPISTPHMEIIRTLNAAYTQANVDWQTFLQQLQGLYPIFTRIERAPEGTNVPLRMIAEIAEPQLLMPPRSEPANEIVTNVPNMIPQNTITLTREQMDQIYTMASGRALTDAAWTMMQSIAAR